VMIHRAYSKDLFTRMIPLNKHWIGQCSLAAVKRLENIELMAASGCKALFIGFESIDEETVKLTGKRQNKPGQYKEVIDMLHEHGISTWGSFVFGFDTDDPEVFDRTVEAGIDMKLTMALYAILTQRAPAPRLTAQHGSGFFHHGARLGQDRCGEARAGGEEQEQCNGHIGTGHGAEGGGEAPLKALFDQQHGSSLPQNQGKRYQAQGNHGQDDASQDAPEIAARLALGHFGMDREQKLEGAIASHEKARVAPRALGSFGFVNGRLSHADGSR